MEFLPAILGAVAVLVGVYTLTTSPPPPRRINARVGTFNRAALPRREQRLAQPFAQRVGAALLAAMRRLLTQFLPSAVVRDIERRLLLAGEPMSLHAYLALQSGALMAALLMGSAILGVRPGQIFSVGILVVAAAVAAGPFIWLESAIAQRRAQILRALPDAVDLIVTMVEAGMSIDSALAKVSQETEGPLADELRFTIRETTLGRSRRDAMVGLLERTDVSELRSFVQAILHAQGTGVPLGQVLRTQAGEIRLRKRQRAEAQAQKAPVKVLLLMLFFIMPSLLLVLLGPAFMRMVEVV